MQYIFITGIIFFFTLKGYCGKRLSCYVNSPSDPYLFNFLRMLFCIFIGIALVFAEEALPFLKLELGMLAICAFSGVSNAAFLVCWMLAVRKNSMVSVDVGLTLGSLIPSVLCLILFSEPFSVPKMFGFAMIICATVVLAGNNKSETKGSFGGIILLSLAAIGDGMSSFSQQLYKQYYTDAGSRASMYYPKTVFHFYTYVFASLVLLLFMIGYYVLSVKSTKNSVSDKKNIRTRRLIPIRALFHISIMAVCLFAGNYLQTVVTNDYEISSQLLYPIIKGCCLITVNFVAMIFFGEKITKRSVLGSLIAIIGIVAMSIL